MIPNKTDKETKSNKWLKNSGILYEWVGIPLDETEARNEIQSRILILWPSNKDEDISNIVL